MAHLDGQKEVACAGVERAVALTAQLSSDRLLLVDGQRLKPLPLCAAAEGAAGDRLAGLLQRIEAHRARAAARVEQLVPDEHRPTLKIWALGHPRVQVDRVTVHWRGAQTRELFYYLLQHPQGLRRDQAGCVFWPDLTLDKVRGNFHATLYYVRQAIAPEIVVFEGGLYRVNWPDGYWYDVEEFESRLDKARDSADGKKAIALLEEALSLYGGDFLGTAGGYWADAEWERLHVTVPGSAGKAGRAVRRPGEYSAGY